MSSTPTRSSETGVLSMTQLGRHSTQSIDALLELVAAQSGMPVAAVMLWEGDWPWLTRSIGLRDERSLDIRLLGLPQAFVAADAALAAGFATSPLVLGADLIRFIATAPIRSLSGALVGTLAVMDRAAHDDGAQLEPLLRNAGAVAACIVAQHRMPFHRSEQTEMLERGVDAAQSGISVCCLNSDQTMPRFLYVNNAIVRRSGLSRGAFLSGRGVFDREPNVAFAHRLAEQMRSGDETPFETEYQGADGRTYELSVHCSRLEAQEGETPHYIVVTEDITERKGRTEITRLFDSLIAETSDLIVIMDATRPSDGGPYARYINAAMSTFLQRPGEELVGRSLRTLISPSTDERTLRTIDYNLERFLPVANEIEFCRADGEKAWTSFTAQPLRDERGEPTCWLFTGRDITARKQQYRQTAQFAEALDASDEPVIMYDVVAPHRLEMSYQNRTAMERHRYLAPLILDGGDPDEAMLALWKRLEQRETLQRMVCVQAPDEPAAWISVEVRPTLDETGALVSLTFIHHVPGGRTRMASPAHPMLFAIALADELLSFTTEVDRIEALRDILGKEWRATISIDPLEDVQGSTAAINDNHVVIEAARHVATLISADGVLSSGSASRLHIWWHLPLATDMITTLRLFLEAIAKHQAIAEP